MPMSWLAEQTRSAVIPDFAPVSCCGAVPFAFYFPASVWLVTALPRHRRSLYPWPIFLFDTIDHVGGSGIVRISSFVARRSSPTFAFRFVDLGQGEDGEWSSHGGGDATAIDRHLPGAAKEE
ncbi:hypothetical protein C8R45DRAFT_1223623 [Mycena sanguinolenta]|nr:hypothetical protein C8R45DRAFT_1223623 [Mycena sanguinolenta]